MKVNIRSIIDSISRLTFSRYHNAAYQAIETDNYQS